MLMDVSIVKITQEEVRWDMQRETHSFRRIASMVLIKRELNLLRKIDNVGSCLLGGEVLKSFGIEPVVRGRSSKVSICMSIVSLANADTGEGRK